MTPALLDTNVLIALLDPSHTFHALVARWFRDNANGGWATCPITQNGFTRIVSHPSYPQPIGVAEALQIMRQATRHSTHRFWPDDITLTDDIIFDDDHVLSSNQTTDTYLLGLAIHRGGYFVTLDRRIDVATVRGASSANLLVLNPRAVQATRPAP